MAADAAPPNRRYRPSSGHRTFGFGAPRRSLAPQPRAAATPRGEAPARTRPPTPSLEKGRVVLDIQDLKTYFFTYDGVVRALEGINLTARAGETTGIVGETGCGKSVTAFSVVRLIGEPGRVISGKIFLNGADLLWGIDKEARYRRVKKTGRVKVIRAYRRIKAANERMSAVRGRGVGMIFQEPMQAMNPVFSISDQLGEAVMLHQGVELLEQLLRADRRGTRVPVRAVVHDVASGEALAESPAALAASPTGTDPVSVLLAAATVGDQDKTRAAAQVLADEWGLPSLATELFYLVRDAGASAPARRARVFRTLRRTRLTWLQRRYVRYQRRLAILDRQMKDVYVQEMRAGKPARRARGKLAIRIRLSKMGHFVYGIWGIGRRAGRPIKNELFWRTVQLLEGVRIANPVQVARGYPHELSGGMLQRAMIAMALSSEPGLLLADEPTTALDVTIQAQILELMRQLRERVGTAIVLITHDLGVVAEVCDRVNVMYAGLIIESAPVRELFRRPLHPYTQGLLASIPRFDQPDKELASIPGSVPNLIHPPPGCRFHPRCPYAMPICKEVRPLPMDVGEEHMVACHLYTETPAGTAAPTAAPVAPGDVSAEGPARTGAPVSGAA